MVAKSKLGTKRACPSCGTKFYDLGKNPVKCPACGEEFDLEMLFVCTVCAKAKRVKRVDVDDEDSIIAYAADSDEDDVVPGEEDELTIIEDASDIGDDSHDMAEVIGSFDKDNMGE